MGAIQQPTTKMKPYAVEVRRESFYLNRAAEGTSRFGRYAARVPAADVAAILAALQQVKGHLAWKEWGASDAAPHDTSWALPPEGEGPVPDEFWTVERQGDDLEIRGPWVIHGDERNIQAEITYQDTEALAEALVPFA
ncbi:hypothetical protein ACFRJ1_17065 [Streptomyces sp. NPDC056773]|uniref:hypothetical protein n=1 Tax=unclassified Streptomyces TaxID=2593676 RepID=UPI0036A0092D